jgi:hypothetical protein
LFPIAGEACIAKAKLGGNGWVAYVEDYTYGDDEVDCIDVYGYDIDDVDNTSDYGYDSDDREEYHEDDEGTDYGDEDLQIKKEEPEDTSDWGGNHQNEHEEEDQKPNLDLRKAKPTSDIEDTKPAVKQEYIDAPLRYNLCLCHRLCQH